MGVSLKRHRVLVVVSDDSVRQALILALEMALSIDVTEASTSAQAIDEIQKFKGFDAVISEYDLKDREAMLQVLSDASLSRKLVYAADIVPDKKVPRIGRLAQVSEILSIIAPMLDSKKTREYLKLSPRALHSMKKLPCDVYVRLSDDKYVKLFHSSQALDETDIESLEKKKIDYLYMTMDGATSYLACVHSEIESLRKAPLDTKASTDAAFAGSQRVLSTIRGFVNVLGMTPELEQLVKDAVDINVKLLKKFPVLEELVQRFAIDPNNYLASHSLVLAYVACAIASKQEWYSDTTKNKFILAALMHDICLNNESMARFRTEQEMFSSPKYDTFSMDDVLEFKNHPAKAAALLSKMKDVPTDVETIVLQHHERPQGTGFPKKLRYDELSPLSAVLIVAQDFVHFQDKNGSEFDPAQFLEANKKDYSNSVFRKIIERIPGFK